MKSFAYENESCGEDINGGCYSDPPVYGKSSLAKHSLASLGRYWILTRSSISETLIGSCLIYTNREPVSKLHLLPFIKVSWSCLKV